jgi:hypothetical protein
MPARATNTYTAAAGFISVYDMAHRFGIYAHFCALPDGRHFLSAFLAQVSLLVYSVI